VGEISDSALLATLRRQMTVAVARQVAASGNLANIDTPGYRAKEVTFDETLSRMTDEQDRGGLLEGSAMAPVTGIGVKEAEGASARRDGNTVQLDRELLTMSRAAGDFAAAQTALAAKFRLIRYAINEGR
jgi:flagellar basal-body rod protein FlgB